MLRESGRLVGLVGLVPSLGPFGLLPSWPEPGPRYRPEVGLYWAVAPSHRRRGLASEAAAALIAHAFAELHLARVVATTERENVASIGVMRRLGMRDRAEPRARAGLVPGGGHPRCPALARFRDPLIQGRATDATIRACRVCDPVPGRELRELEGGVRASTSPRGSATAPSATGSRARSTIPTSSSPWSSSRRSAARAAYARDVDRLDVQQCAHARGRPAPEDVGRGHPRDRRQGDLLHVALR